MDRSLFTDRSPTWSRRLQRQRPDPHRIPSVTYPDRLRPGPDKDEDVASIQGMQAHMNQSMFSLIAAAGSRTDFHQRFGEESSGSETEKEGEGKVQEEEAAQEGDDDDDDDNGKGSDSRRNRRRKTKSDNRGSAREGRAGECSIVGSSSAHAIQVGKKSVEQKTTLGAGTPAGSEHLEHSPAAKEVVEEEDIPESLLLDDTRRGKDERGGKLLQSLPRLLVKSQRERNYLSQSMFLPPRSSSASSASSGRATPRTGLITPRDAPVMRTIIEAEAKYEKESGNSQQATQSKLAPAGIEDSRSPDSRPKLMSKLKEIFGFDELEEVISEYPCWLLKSVLLQGYLYVTERHFCFYAYLPKKTNMVLKSGNLWKKAKRGPKYKRQWFVLKGDVLSYYDNASSQYFQNGYVDLRFATSASHDGSGEEDQEKRKNFTVNTPDRIYYFTADSGASAKEWVKILQKVIFRTHNDGESVKIKLPIANVSDIEESPVIEVAKTVRIQVFEGEGFALDEYYFSFFSFGQDAISVMKSMVPSSEDQHASSGPQSPTSIGDSPRAAPNLLKRHEASDEAGIKRMADATVFSTKSSARGRMDAHQKLDDHNDSDSPGKERGLESDVFQRTISFGEEKHGGSSLARAARSRARDSLSEFSPLMKASERSESFVDSIAALSGPEMSVDDFQSSGSQVLSRSDIFRAQSTRRTDSPGQSDDEPAHPGNPSSAARHTDSRSATPRLPEQSEQDLASSPVEIGASTPGLTKLIKAGQYPLQQAVGLAGMLHRGSKDMSALLATKSMGYVEKVSGMWAGGRTHYRHGVAGPEDVDRDMSGDAQAHAEAGNRFRTHFGLPESERLLAAYFGSLHRVLPLYGKIYISDKFFCFRSLLPGTNTKIILPLKDMETVHKEKGFRIRYSGLVVVIQGFEELFFEFSQKEIRDDCAVFLHRRLDESKILSESMHSSNDEEGVKLARAEHKALMEARQDGDNMREIALPKLEDSVNAEDMPAMHFDDPRASILNFKPAESLRITCLTIGSRGDVQPYIALCKGFLAEGHRPKIATHAEFEPWVRKHGIDFEPVDGDPAELMRICIENGMFTYSFLREASAKFRGWIDDLLTSSWKACQGSDLLIESPSAMAGIHIAEALKIPYFRAFTMPWTRTRAYPHAFAVPEHRMGGAYNWLTYVMFDNVFWAAISGQVNRWRKRELKIPSTTLEKLHPNKVPFLYNFSPSVVIPPVDFSDWIRVTGYWFLDEGRGYEPDKALSDFIAKARADGKKLVYIGFGSIVVSNPRALTESIVEAVLKADVRCILSKGWSDRLGKESDKVEVPLPADILQIKSCPHDWLFRQVDCAVHHGGAGTTGASLRAGLPTIVKPFFGDQFFFGNRIEDLQVGIYMRKLNVSVLSRALWEATHSERMIVKARVLGEQIRREDGVATAIQAIYRDMEYAKSLIKNHDPTTAAAAADSSADRDAGNGFGDEELDNEESWTFVEEDDDQLPELSRRIAALDELRSRAENEMIRAGQAKEGDFDFGAIDKGDKGRHGRSSQSRVLSRRVAAALAAADAEGEDDHMDPEDTAKSYGRIMERAKASGSSSSIKLKEKKGGGREKDGGAVASKRAGSKV